MNYVSAVSTPETTHFLTLIAPCFTSMNGLPFFNPALPKPVQVDRNEVKLFPILESKYNVPSTAS